MKYKKGAGPLAKLYLSYCKWKLLFHLRILKPPLFITCFADLYRRIALSSDSVPGAKSSTYSSFSNTLVVSFSISATKAYRCELNRTKISNNDGTKFGPRSRHLLIDNSSESNLAVPLNTIQTFVVALSSRTTAW